MGNLFQEIKRRKVFRVAAIYAVVAWVLIQVADTIAPLMNLTESAPRLVLFLLIILFPIALFLAWAYEVTPEGIKSDSGFQASTQVPAPQSQRLIYATFVLVLLAVGFQVVDRFFLQGNTNTIAVIGSTGEISGSTSELSWRTRINLGVADPIGGSGLTTDIALSPDGRRLVFVFDSGDGDVPKLYLREFDQLESQLLTADIALAPFFSPDGEWVGFWRQGELHKVSIRGGQSQQLSESILANGGGYWSSDDTIFYTSDFPDAQLQQIAATGGVPQPLEAFRSSAISLHSWPYLLPDGDSLLFTVRDSPGAVRNRRIDLLTLPTGDVRTIIQGGYNARYVPTGHIVFMRSASLWAVPFDLHQLETTGPEVSVIQGVQTNGDRGGAIYAFSNTGLLVYLPGEDIWDGGELRTLVWVDRDGNEESLSVRRTFRTPAVSPDGQQLAVVIIEDNITNIWIYDLTREQLSLLTFDEANDYYPLWTPDGERIVFSSTRDGGGLWWRAADGTGKAEPLLSGVPNARPTSFTPDERQLVYDANGDLFLLTLDSESLPQPLIQSEFIESRAAISPNGRWIAYESNRTGEFEIYVRPFPKVDDGGQWLISSEGGQWPRWNTNGNELFYRTGEGADGAVWAVQVETDNSFQFGIPVRLIQGYYRGSGALRGAFDISADGSRFMLINSDFTPVGGPQEASLVVVHNWFEELKRLAPADSQ